MTTTGDLQKIRKNVDHFASTIGDLSLNDIVIATHGTVSTPFIKSVEQRLKRVYKSIESVYNELQSISGDISGEIGTACKNDKK